MGLARIVRDLAEGADFREFKVKIFFKHYCILLIYRKNLRNENFKHFP